MSRSALFQSPLAERDRLVYIRGFLDWLNNERGTKQELAEGFWRWFIGFPDGPLRGRWKKHMEGHLADTRHWKWRKLQAGLRKTVEGAYDYRRSSQSAVLRPIWLTLRARRRSDRREYFELQVVLPTPLTASRLAPLVLYEFFGGVDNLAEGAVARCRLPTCRRLFVRLRAVRRLFCSKRCRNLAVLEGLTQKAGRTGKRTGARTKARGAQ